MTQPIPGPCDFHSHLVPGVDDGARDLEDSLEGIERMKAAGFNRILTTPHLNASIGREPGGFAPRFEEVRAAFETLRVAAAERWPEVQLAQGFEVMLDIPDVDLEDEGLRLAGTRFMLVEWPRLQIPPGTHRVIERLVASGIRPVIAHPERYGGMEHTRSIAREWRDMGALLQVNYGSFVGRYGSEAREMAYRLMEAGRVDYLASDFHGKSALSIYCREAHEALGGKSHAGLLDTLTRVNPGRLLDGLDPLPSSPLPASNVLQRIRRIMVRHDRTGKKRTT